MKVLIPVDGSAPSQNTVAWASSVFNPQHTQYYLLVVVPKTIPELSTEEYEIEDALRVLNTYTATITKNGGTVAKAEYIIGDPAQAICQYADELQVDQILMGSHGRTGLSKLLLGSVSTAVFEHAKQPVFIYRNQPINTQAG